MKHLPRVYLASKLYHAPLWRDYKLVDWMEVVSTWHHSLTIEQDDTDPAIATRGWQQNMVDLRRAEYLVAYAHADDKLNGTLVEIGVAAQRGIPIFVAGAFPWGTWRYLHNVTVCSDLSTAFNLLRGIK